jgi:hypothetical protein
MTLSIMETLGMYIIFDQYSVVCCPDIVVSTWRYETAVDKDRLRPVKTRYIIRIQTERNGETE